MEQLGQRGTFGVHYQSRGYVMTSRGYVVTSCGYVMTSCGYVMTSRGYVVASCGYVVTNGVTYEMTYVMTLYNDPRGLMTWAWVWSVGDPLGHVTMTVYDNP